MNFDNESNHVIITKIEKKCVLVSVTSSSKVKCKPSAGLDRGEHVITRVRETRPPHAKCG